MILPLGFGEASHDALLGAVIVAIISSITTIWVATLNRKATNNAAESAADHHDATADRLVAVEERLEALERTISER